METDRTPRRWWPAWRPSRAQAVDAAVAVVLAVVQTAGAAFAGREQDAHDPLDLRGGALLVIGSLALAVRRRYPVPVYAVTFLCTAGYVLLGYPFGPIWFSMILALATLVMAGQRVAALVAITVGYVTFTWLPYVVGVEDAPSVAAAVGLAAWLLLLLAIAEVLRARRDRAEAAERTREEESRRRVTEERLRIARELHDVVAHNISMINLQSGVALHLIDENPDQARTALAAIKDASKETLVELRSVLGVLRQVDEASGASAPRDPAPGLSRLPDLVSQANAAGLRVRSTVEGAPRPLGASLDLAGFRIVQEALTNVTRHAGPSVAAEVRVVYGPRELAVEVVDEGSGAASPGSSVGSGNGLTGMRERAESLGGRFEAGPRPGFGWRVRATMPYEPPEDRPDGPAGDAAPAGGAALDGEVAR